MTFQTRVNRQYTAGFAGELIEDGPKRARPGRIVALPQNAIATGPNRISRVFGFAGSSGAVGAGPVQTEAARTYDVVVGGADFYGVLGHPKHYAMYGGSGGALSPTYDLPNGAEGEFFDMATGLVVELMNFSADEITVGHGFDIFYVGYSCPAASNPNGLPAGAIFVVERDSDPIDGTYKLPGFFVGGPITIPASAPGSVQVATAIIQLTH